MMWEIESSEGENQGGRPQIAGKIRERRRIVSVRTVFLFVRQRPVVITHKIYLNKPSVAIDI